MDARPADLGVDLVLRLVEEEAAREALAVEHGSHSFRAPAAVGADHDPVASVGELTQATGEPGGIAQYRRPARSLKRDRARALGDGEQRRDLGGGVLQEPVEAEVEPRHPFGDVGRLEPPGRRQALAERDLLVQELGRSVT